MNQEPNFDSEATRMAPPPGTGRAAAAEAWTRAAPAATEATPAELAALQGMNPLVAAANVLLASIPRIRATVSHPDPAALRETLLQQISQFESVARARGVAPETVVMARYALCTVIDESVACTPWGGTADWVRRSLLVILHNEVAGGEKFFQLLNRLAEDPARNIDLLELQYVCLALGFEGRFRVIDNGRSQLEALRDKLAGVIRQQRGPLERDLSSQWRGEVAPVGRSSGFLTLWAALAVAAALLLGVYLWLAFALDGQSAQLAFGKVQAARPVRQASALAAPPRLRKFLEAEIQAGLVEVLDSAAESRVLLRGTDLFESGNATIQPGFEPTLARISAALNQVEGSVTVVGHTDNQPIRSARFPSNMKLSEERAQSVARQMAPQLRQPARMAAEGRADQEPLGDNASETGRARNRRVEIVLRVPAGQP